jgi:hypothetical protein
MVEYFSPAEDRVFAVARGLLEEFVRGREGYEPKVEFGLFASGGSDIRMHLSAIPRNESVPRLYYSQWMADTYGFGSCSLTLGDNPASQLKLDFHELIEVLEERLRVWLSRELAQ